jgi:hypothetical protein
VTSSKKQGTFEAKRVTSSEIPGLFFTHADTIASNHDERRVHPFFGNSQIDSHASRQQPTGRAHVARV